MSAKDTPRAFPSVAIADEHGGMSKVEWYAGCALLAAAQHFDPLKISREDLARSAFDMGEAIAAEAERRRA